MLLLALQQFIPATHSQLTPITRPEPEVDSHLDCWSGQSNFALPLPLTYQYPNATDFANNPTDPLASGPPVSIDLHPAFQDLTPTFTSNPIYADTVISSAFPSTVADFQTLVAYQVNICYPIHLYDF